MKRGWWHAAIVGLNSKHQKYMMWTHLTRCSRSDIIPRCGADGLCLKAWIVLLQNCPRGSIITSISQCSVLSFRALKFLWCCENRRQMSSTLCRQNRIISVGHSKQTGFILSFKTLQKFTMKWHETNFEIIFSKDDVMLLMIMNPDVCL